MVNENLKLIENYKKIEEVRELKDEYKIPSFEEFMKNYEDDANLNYEDLNNSNIGNPKGYGPVFGDGGGSNNYSSGSEKFWTSCGSSRDSSSVGREVIHCKAEGCSSWWFRGDGSLDSWEYQSLGYCCAHPEWRREKGEIEQGRRIVKWVGKTATTTIASYYLGPVAFKVGGLLWGTTKVVENFVDNEDMREVLRFIGDVGYDTAKGAFIGKLVGLGSNSLASKTTQEIGHRAAAEISSNGGKITENVKDLIEIGRLISFGQRKYELYSEYGKPVCELARHEYHKKQGRSYDSNCEVCKA